MSTTTKKQNRRLYFPEYINYQMMIFNMVFLYYLEYNTIVAILLWYTVSYFFLCHPLILHSKQTKLKMSLLPKYLVGKFKEKKYVYGESPPFLVTHRGGSLDGPENTLQSFMTSVKNEIDMIECDVRMTKDGHIIVAHDDTFKRICKENGQWQNGQTFRETNLADLPEFKDSMPISFSHDKSVQYKRQFGDQKTFTTLEEIFKKLPKEQIIQIEVKDHLDEAVLKTLKLVQKYKRQSTTVVGSLNTRLMDLIRTTDPTIPTFASWIDVAMFQLWFVLGLSPYFKVKFESMSGAFMTKEFAKMKMVEKSQVEGFFKKIQFDIYVPMVQIFNYIQDSQFLFFNRMGIFTNVWVINDDEDIDFVYKKTNAAGIMTDRGPYVKQMMLQYYEGER